MNMIGCILNRHDYFASYILSYVVWSLELGDFPNRFPLVNKIEIWKKIYVELFAASILNKKVSQMTNAATLESSSKF